MTIFISTRNHQTNPPTGGDHARKKKVSYSKVGGMMAFARVGHKCVGCRAAVQEREGAVCKHCVDKEGVIYVKEVVICI